MTQSKELAPHISINAQYIKDLSFENPNAPASLANIQNPEVNLAVLDVGITQMPEKDVFEVSLHIEASATSEGRTLFVVDLMYAGVFTLFNIDEDEYKPLLAIHCPSMIFPFARKIIADVTQDGGFQALMIDPIDFAALFHRKMAESEADGPHTLQ